MIEMACRGLPARWLKRLAGSGRSHRARLAYSTALDLRHWSIGGAVVGNAEPGRNAGRLVALKGVASVNADFRGMAKCQATTTESSARDLHRTSTSYARASLLVDAGIDSHGSSRKSKRRGRTWAI